MARVLIKYWDDLIRNDIEWEHHIIFRLTGTENDETFGNVEEMLQIPIDINDTAAQIRTAVSDAIRALTISKYGTTVPNNQIIWPDATRS